MKKIVYEVLYVLLALALVVGGVKYALPDINVDLTSAPLASPIPAYVEGVEEVAAYLNEEIPPTMTVLVLNFWSPECKYCLEQLVALNTVAHYRADVGVVALTTETDADLVTEIGVGLDLQYSTLYGLPEFPLPTVPNTHVLMRGEDGVWRVLPEGTWIGSVEAEVIIQFIVDNMAE